MYLKGVYKHLDDVPITNDGYRNLDWIDEMYEGARKRLRQMEEKVTHFPIPLKDQHTTKIYLF
jgi:hypothetical protein